VLRASAIHAHLFVVVIHIVSIGGKGQNRAVVARTALA
jgi:hypothetical protein